MNEHREVAVLQLHSGKLHPVVYSLLMECVLPLRTQEPPAEPQMRLRVAYPFLLKQELHRVLTGARFAQDSKPPFQLLLVVAVRIFSGATGALLYFLSAFFVMASAILFSGTECAGMALAAAEYVLLARVQLRRKQRQAVQEQQRERPKLWEYEEPKVQE